MITENPDHCKRCRCPDPDKRIPVPYFLFLLKDFATEPLTGFASVSSCSSVETGDICTAGPYTSPVPPEDTSFSVPRHPYCHLIPVAFLIRQYRHSVPAGFRMIPSGHSDPVQFRFLLNLHRFLSLFWPPPALHPSMAGVHQEAHIHVFPDTRYNPSSRRLSPFPLQYAELFRL